MPLSIAWRSSWLSAPSRLALARAPSTQDWQGQPTEVRGELRDCSGESRGILEATTRGNAGRRAVSRLRTLEGYTLTALAALEITARVLGGVAPIGYHTPASAYGPDLILAIPGCERQDDPIAT
jgi:short subunit dehydrogenase-like uncharacterized protein